MKTCATCAFWPRGKWDGRACLDAAWNRATDGCARHVKAGTATMFERLMKRRQAVLQKVRVR
jgi:hypothetical protein